MVDKYLSIINHFGLENQKEKLREEVEEFIEAVKENNYEHIVEEMADILTLLTQFIFFYRITKEEMDEMMDYKLDRTLKRIKSGYYEK